MCSRYTYNPRKEAFVQLLEVEAAKAGVREVIRPTDLAPIVIPGGEAFICQDMRWGWVVPWEKSLLINAKSETITTLKTFQPHLNNRCVLLATGFYEKGVRFGQSSDQPFGLAGLWRTEGDTARFVMLTTTPNETVAPFHNRMPFVLRSDQQAEWLRGNWEQVLAAPDRSPLEKFQKQPDLFC